MRSLLFIVPFSLLVTLVACTDPPPTTETDPPTTMPVTLTDDGAWCWFSDPRALYFAGEHRRTYAGWMDAGGSVVLGYYDHDSGEITTHILQDSFEVDDHDNPALLMDESGRLWVFYVRHSRQSPIYLAQATQPESITDWAPARELHLNDTIAYAGFRNSYTYTNIGRLSTEDDKLFIFWRGMDFKPNVAYSTDDGATWSSGEILILPNRTYQNRRPYLKVSSNHRDRFHLAFTDGHPRNEPTNSIYYAQYRANAFYRADGSKIGDWANLPLDPVDADLVYAADSSGRAWIWDVAEAADGRPVLTYVRFPDDTTHVYYYATYTEGQWQNHRLVDAGDWFPQTQPGATEREPNYSGGLVLDHEDPSVVYLSVQRDGVFEIEKWTTPDLGKSWRKESITQNSERDNVRPFAVRHQSDSTALNVLWMEVDRYVHYTDYRAAIKGN